MYIFINSLIHSIGTIDRQSMNVPLQCATSPRRFSRILLCSVKCLSLTLPPQASDMKVIYPEGAMLIRNFYSIVMFIV